MSDQPLSPEAAQVSKLLKALGTQPACRRLPFSTQAIAEALLQEEHFALAELLRYHLEAGVVAELVKQLAEEVVGKRS